jgi:acyl carrier protein
MSLQLLDQIRQIAADTFNEELENVTALSTPDTLANWDSLTHLNFLLAMEQSFGCEFEPEEGERAGHSIAEALDVVQKKLGRS